MQGHNSPIPWQEKRLNYNQAAEVTGLSAQTLRLYVMKKIIPYEKAGRRVLFRAGTLVEWLSSKAVKS